MKFEDFSWKDIVMEAPGDEAVEEDEELSATDYADADNLEVEEEAPEEEPTEGEEPTEDELAEDEGATDYTEEEGEEEPAEGEEGTDETGEETPEEEPPEDEQLDNSQDKYIGQNKHLVQDYIELYNRLEEIENILRRESFKLSHRNPKHYKVRANIGKLKELTYDYVINKFEKNSYVENLYQFNMILQAANVNIEAITDHKKIKEYEAEMKRLAAEKAKKRKNR
jgi:hypothetical protein